MRKIQELRLKSGMSRESLARKAGLNNSMVYRYEQDGADPRLSETIKLANALGVSPSTLLKSYQKEQTNGHK